MKLLIIGATGHLGSALLAHAAAGGHEVIAFARRPEAVPALPGVTAVRGAAEDVAALTSAADGTDAMVVSITGSMRDKSFLQERLPGILTAARDAGVGRVVLVSVFGAGDTFRQLSPMMRLTMGTLLRGFVADRAVAETQLKASGLPWTVVYPVNLKAASAAGTQALVPLHEIASVPGMPSLAFDDAAAGLLLAATNPGYAGGRLLLAPKGSWRPLA